MTISLFKIIQNYSELLFNIIYYIALNDSSDMEKANRNYYTENHDPELGYEWGQWVVLDK